MGFKVKKTRCQAPVRVLVYGNGGVGKSTFGAAAPDPIFLASEDGLKNIDAEAVTIEDAREPDGVRYPQTWTEVLQSLDFVAMSGKKTLVVDSLDWLEPLIWAHVCEQGKKKHILDFGWGDGFIAALDEWRLFLRRLEMLSSRQGMNIVLIAHAIQVSVTNTEGEDYASWTIKLQDSKKSSAAALVREWCDVVGFAQDELGTYKAGKSSTVKGITTGKRLLRTKRSAAYYAKTRYALPEKLALDWRAFARAVEDGSRNPVERLQGVLAEKLKELGDKAAAAKCAAFLEEHGTSVDSLTDAIGTVDEYLAERAAMPQAVAS